MDHDLARPVVLAGALPAAFESAFLIRCAGATRLAGQRCRPLVAAAAGPRNTVAARTGLVEFDREEAAARLAALLTGLGFTAGLEAHDGGGQRRYRVHRVAVPGPDRPVVNRTMAAAWQQGRATLHATGPVGTSSPRHVQRTALARAAWRAASLGCGRVRRRDLIGLRLGDQDLAALLVRAARVLGVPTTVERRSGCLVLTIPPEGAHLLVPGRGRPLAGTAAGRG
ncbi:hypothetical protein [Actinoplanes sp. NPDC051851]|uniref:hypothetical protein n=1 Tax=Actinoplanes sp. NPDC051851 TaxID=3154753 RepID=UPI003449C7EE